MSFSRSIFAGIFYMKNYYLQICKFILKLLSNSCNNYSKALELLDTRIMNTS